MTIASLPGTMTRLRADQSGLALVEFALGLPILLTIGLCGIEATNLAIANLRISQIATTTADNAGRAGASSDPAAAMDEGDVNELLLGAKLTGASIKFAQNGRIILSSLEPTSDGTRQWIRWQRCAGEKRINSSYGVPRTEGNTAIRNGTEMSAPSNQARSVPRNGSVATPTAMGPAGNQISASAGTAVMFVEVVYDYQPVVSESLFGPITLRYTSAFNVRQRTDNRLLNSGNLADANRSLCNQYTA